MNLLQALHDDNLFAPLFPSSTWGPWKAAIAALFGLPMHRDQRKLYIECTGRTAPPRQPFSEAAFIVGRRGGKSRVLALVAVYLAAFKDYTPHLAPGETPVIAIVAADRKQARVILKYCAGLLREVPLMASLLEEELVETLRLTNRVQIEIHTGSIASPRGRTFVAVLADEISFWKRDDAVNPDAEVIASVRPGLASIPNSMLLMASSPYSRRGVLWDTYKRHYGRDDSRTLVWKAPTLTMNPQLPPAIIQAAYDDDPASAAAEYGAEFRSDIEAFITREIIEACTDRYFELAPVSPKSYVAFCDPSGGSSDSMTLAIAHVEQRDGQRIAIVDALRERTPPFSPDAVVSDFANLVKAYGIREVEGDRYGGEWPADRFRAHGINYKSAERSKSDIYRELLPTLNGQRVVLPDLPKLAAQFVGLERRTARGGRDSIDHSPNAHDDLANACAGAIVKLLAQPGQLEVWLKLAGAAA
jgi:hypothetical protein